MSLVLNILLPILAAVVVNAIIFYFKWNRDNGRGVTYKYLPPGWMVGSIWIVLLGLLGYVRWMVRNDTPAQSTVTFLIVFCVMYPFYTLGLKDNIGRVMNVITLIVAFSSALVVLNVNINAMTAMIPLLMWASYVNITQIL